MSLRLCLSLLPLLVAGCASEVLVVPDSDWQKVPAAERDAVERQIAADLASIRAELAAATASLAEMKRSQPPPPPAKAPTATRAPTGDLPAGNGDEPAAASHSQDQAGLRAKAQVEAAKAAWQRADLTWRQLRVDAANARLETIGYQRELARAQAVDHNLPGTDHYDVAPVRGQFSHAQQHWHSVASAAAQARTAFEQASANLASAKEAYAQLIRGGPPPSSMQPATAGDDRAPLLPLPGWAITRSDILRRRGGLRHFLDAVASPQLHAVAIQLSAWRVVVPPAAAATASPAADLTKPPTGGSPSNLPSAASTPTAKPADRPASPTSPAAKPSSDHKLPI